METYNRYTYFVGSTTKECPETQHTNVHFAKKKLIFSFSHFPLRTIGQNPPTSLQLIRRNSFYFLFSKYICTL